MSNSIRVVVDESAATRQEDEASAAQKSAEPAASAEESAPVVAESLPSPAPMETGEGAPIMGQIAPPRAIVEPPEWRVLRVDGMLATPWSPHDVTLVIGDDTPPAVRARVENVPNKAVPCEVLRSESFRWTRDADGGVKCEHLTPAGVTEITPHPDGSLLGSRCKVLVHDVDGNPVVLRNVWTEDAPDRVPGSQFIL